MLTIKTSVRALVLLLVSALLWSAPGSVASAQSVKDQQLISEITESVKAAIAATTGTRFEVNAVGNDFANSILTDKATMAKIVARAKAACTKLNAVAKKGPKAVKAQALKIGADLGKDQRTQLISLESDPDLTFDDKFSIGVVIGMVNASMFTNGMNVYCPRHAKQASVLVQAINAAIIG